MTHDTHRSPLAPYLAKLERRSSFSLDIRAALEALPYTVVTASPRDVIVEECSRSISSLFLVNGYVSRRKRCNDEAQIIGLGIPGDAVDLQSLMFDKADHSLVAQTSVEACLVSHQDLFELAEREPVVAKAFWHDTLVDAAIFREWTLNIAHRPAAARIGHFLLEMHARQEAHGITSGGSVDLPMNQADLASALGLSLVHTNKSLRALKHEGLIDCVGRRYNLLNICRLRHLTQFNADYLHIDHAPKL